MKTILKGFINVVGQVMSHFFTRLNLREASVMVKRPRVSSADFLYVKNKEQ